MSQFIIKLWFLILNHYRIIIQSSTDSLIYFPDENLKASITGRVSKGTRLGKRFPRLPESRIYLCVCHVACLKFQKHTTGLQIAPLFRLKSEVVFDNYAVGKKRRQKYRPWYLCENLDAQERISPKLLTMNSFLSEFTQRNKILEYGRCITINKMNNICYAHLKIRS